MKLSSLVTVLLLVMTQTSHFASASGLDSPATSPTEKSPDQPFTSDQGKAIYSEGMIPPDEQFVGEWTLIADQFREQDGWYNPAGSIFEDGTKVASPLITRKTGLDGTLHTEVMIRKDNASSEDNYCDRDPVIGVKTAKYFQFQEKKNFTECTYFKGLYIENNCRLVNHLPDRMICERTVRVTDPNIDQSSGFTRPYLDQYLTFKDQILGYRAYLRVKN